MKLFIAGHNGMAGSAILRKFQREGTENLITASRSDLDLTNEQAVKNFFDENGIQTVIIAAAKVGGIQANINNPVEFLLDNLLIQNNLIRSALNSGVKKIIFLSSSCVYPKHCKQPMHESDILTGALEPTNEGYALAKLTGMKLLDAISKTTNVETLSLIPCNLYGPNDSFDLEKSHVLSALVKRFSDAKNEKLNEVNLWGTGIARREFMHVDDLADAVFYFYNQQLKVNSINVGPGDDISIRELADLIASKVEFHGKINWDSTKPDGMLKKCMDVTLMKQLGFTPKITLSEGIDQMIGIYKELKN